jgi:hypothetical protein
VLDDHGGHADLVLLYRKQLSYPVACVCQGPATVYTNRISQHNVYRLLLADVKVEEVLSDT